MVIRRKLRTFRAQPAAVRRRLPAVWLALITVSWSLRWLGFARTHRWLSSARGFGRAAADATGSGRLDAAAVALAARNIPARARCLERALTLWWLLWRRRLDASVRIGVRRISGDGGPIEAHAWVELGGEVLGDRADVGQRYAAFEGDVAALARAIRLRQGAWWSKPEEQGG